MRHEAAEGKDFCGEVSLDGRFMCLRPLKHEGPHGDERWVSNGGPTLAALEGDTPTARPELSPLLTMSEAELSFVRDGLESDEHTLLRELDAQRAALAASQRDYSASQAHVAELALELKTCVEWRDGYAKSAKAYAAQAEAARVALARTQAEREALREALRACVSVLRLSSAEKLTHSTRCVDYDPAGSTYESTPHEWWTQAQAALTATASAAAEARSKLEVRSDA
jgi:hypothetical protein